MHLTRIAASILLTALAVGPASAAELVLAEMKSDLVPNPVPYAVLLPDGYKDSAQPLPLLIMLHGGGGNRDMLASFKPMFEELWQSGRLSKMIVTAPSTTSRGFYMDRKDGTEKWESFIIGPYRELMEKTYHASTNPKEHFLTGISMGGMGTLRIGFKHPEMFGGIAALEAGIEPILHWKDMQPRHRFYREEGLFEAAFGKPVDAEYWEANNPASIAQKDPRRLIRSGLQIYFDAAGHDMFFLYEGNEFLHRLLYDNGVEHEYHLVEGADHVGRTMRPRMMEAVLFLNRALNPAPPDPAVINARKQLVPLKAKVGIKDPLDPKQ
jgi:S-formylglutathione hydrolase